MPDQGLRLVLRFGSVLLINDLSSFIDSGDIRIGLLILNTVGDRVGDTGSKVTDFGALVKRNSLRFNVNVGVGLV